MKVFISWSGERSKLLALALRDWLRPILQSIDVWMSQADIEAGERWGQEVARELASCNFGIICVTPENVNASWLLFEAGALAKSLEDAKVIPLLFDLELREISGPLAQFQAKKFDKSGLSEVVKSINSSLPAPISDDVVNPLLNAMWPGLQGQLELVPKRIGDAKKSRSQSDILEELVQGVRSFDSRLRDTEMVLSEGGPRSRRRRPRFVMEMIMLSFDQAESSEPLWMLLVAGMLREDMPWISEIFTEAYREVKRGNWRSLHRLPDRVHNVGRIMARGPFLEESGWGGKDLHMLISELPVLVSRFVDQMEMMRAIDSKRNPSKGPSSLAAERDLVAED